MTTRVAFCVVGQSNEAGSGQSIDNVRRVGGPLIDPVLPGGQAKRSWWPRLAELMAARSVWLGVTNTAVGGTSIAKSWCGQPLTWVSGIIVRTGSLILSSDGHLWKCNVSASSQVASTVEPLGTSNTTGADSIPWLYLGAPTATDIAGNVLVEGNTHFDPNSYLSTAYTNLNAMVGYDKKAVIISFGQTDADLTTSRAAFAAAYISTANYFLARNVQVVLGFSCYCAVSGNEAWYQSNLLPGYQDALTSFAGNANVFAGANLRTALGVLTVSPAAGSPGLQSDQYHMVDISYYAASAAWDAALSAVGF